MATQCLNAQVSAWIERLASLLDRRVAWRLLPLLTGLLFATGRRTLSSWLRAGRLSKDYQDYYYFVSTLGHKVKSLAAVVLQIAVEVIAPPGRILVAIDDTPSKRYGPKVEGAGVHHNPTPGPAGAKFIYGHVWVTLAWVVQHPLWGAIGLPLLARLYVRQKDIDAQQLTFLRKVTFQTKLVMAYPQATGIMMPHTPTPTNSKIVIVNSSSPVSNRPASRPTHHHNLVFCSSTSLSTRSVISPYV